MRILFLAHRFPYPPTFGSKLRAFHMIRHLARANEVTVLSPARSGLETAHAQGISALCRSFEVFRVGAVAQAAKVVATIPTSISASEAYFHSYAMQRRIRQLLARQRFDMIVVHCSSVGHYVEQVQDMPKLIDYCDVDSQKWRDYARFKPWPLSAGYWWEAVRMERVEQRLAGRFNAVTVATRGEAELLASLGVNGSIDWVPNGVDIDYFRPSADDYDPHLVSFVGRMDYFPNEQCMVDFCADVLPKLRARCPQLHLQIVGAYPTRRVRRLARLPGVTVTGAVVDVRPYVTRSALTVAPLTIARGTQNKILESMAMGVPVVASTVAAAGVDAVSDEHLLVADDAQGFCDAILRIVQDPGERRRLAEAGRARAESHYVWEAAMQRFDAVVARCVNGASQ